MDTFGLAMFCLVPDMFCHLEFLLDSPGRHHKLFSHRFISLYWRVLHRQGGES